MSRIVTAQDSSSVYPTSYDSGYRAESVQNLNNGCTAVTSSNYATINITKAAQAETEIYYNFGDFNFPDGATILSVACSVKCQISSTSGRVAKKTVQLYSGTTAKGSAYTLGTSATAFSLTTGTWTASELQNAKLRICAKRSASNTSTQYYIRFYGTTLTVTYSYNQTLYTVTSSSSTSRVTISPASTEAPEGVRVYLSIVGDISNIKLEDNGVDVTSDITPDGTNYAYNIVNIQEDHTVLVSSTIVGNTTFIKQSGVWKEVTNTLIKVNNSWHTVVNVYKKVNGVWTLQSDNSALFDNDAVFITN